MPRLVDTLVDRTCKFSSIDQLPFCVPTRCQNLDRCAPQITVLALFPMIVLKGFNLDDISSPGRDTWLLFPNIHHLHTRSYRSYHSYEDPPHADDHKPFRLHFLEVLSCQTDFCMLTDSTNIHLTLATNVQIAWVRDYVCQRFIMYTTTGAKSASHIIFLAEWLNIIIVQLPNLRVSILEPLRKPRSMTHGYWFAAKPVSMTFWTTISKLVHGGVSNNFRLLQANLNLERFDDPYAPFALFKLLWRRLAPQHFAVVNPCRFPSHTTAARCYHIYAVSLSSS